MRVIRNPICAQRDGAPVSDPASRRRFDRAGSETGAPMAGGDGARAG